MRTIEAVRVPTATEAALLGLLADGPLSGYDLHRRVEAGVGHVWTPAKSRVYAVLPRLVDEGLLTRREVAQTHRPDKHLYTLTDEGRAAFERWVREPAWRSHDEFLLKVFFGDALAAEELAALVSRYREQETARLAEYRAIEDRISGSPRDRFRYQTLRWGLAAARARIRWADEALRTLAKETATS